MRDGAIGPSSAETPVLDLLLDLLTAFHEHRIAYCYWKSSRRIAEVLAGDADLDLLIAHPDQHRAQQVLLQSGFKFFPSVPAREHPAVSSFLGHDEASGRIVHVHMHLRLVAGERLFKNYRLPWEATVLAQAVAHPRLPIRMLDPATEAVLLAVRACLELRRSDPVTLRNWDATRRKFELDRAALAARVDRPTLRTRAAELMGDDLGDVLADAVHGGQPLETQRRLRRRVRRALAPHRLYNAVEGRLRSAWRTVRWAAGGLNKRSLHLPRPWSRRAPGGGSVVAVLGVDGSGKSTVVATLRSWLGAEIDVMPIYFGTGDGRPSVVLLPLKLLVPLISRLIRSKPKGSSHGNVSSRPPGAVYSLLLMLWASVLAVEKRLKLLRARRAAERGMIVVADRYPQDQILDFNDGPLLPRLSKAPRWLRRFEANSYALASRLPPDLVIKLDVTKEVVARREPDMDAGVVEQRIASVRQLSFPGIPVVRVDAMQPLAGVIATVKREVWRVL